MNVLVAENDKFCRDQAVVALNNFGTFNVDVAMGTSALDMIRQKSYDFVLLGINPGDPTGPELLHGIRERDTNLEILVMAGDIIAKNMGREKAQSNIFAFIQKPIDPLGFHRTVNRLKTRILERK